MICDCVISWSHSLLLGVLHVFRKVKDIHASRVGCFNNLHDLKWQCCHFMEYTVYISDLYNSVKNGLIYFIYLYVLCTCDTVYQYET